MHSVVIASRIHIYGRRDSTVCNSEYFAQIKNLFGTMSSLVKSVDLCFAFESRVNGNPLKICKWCRQRIITYESYLMKYFMLLNFKIETFKLHIQDLQPIAKLVYFASSLIVRLIPHNGGF